MFEVRYAGADMLSLNEWLGCNGHAFLMLVLCRNSANNTWNSLKTHFYTHTHTHTHRENCLFPPVYQASEERCSLLASQIALDFQFQAIYFLLFPGSLKNVSSPHFK